MRVREECGWGGGGKGMMGGMNGLGNVAVGLWLSVVMWDRYSMSML